MPFRIQLDSGLCVVAFVLCGWDQKQDQTKYMNNETPYKKKTIIYQGEY